MQRRHLEGAAAQLETDIHHTRMLAVARNAPLRISFETSAAGSCYVIHTGAANQCGCNAADGTATCQGGAEAERSVRFAAGDAVSLKSNLRSVVFDATKGTSTPTATVQLTARDGMTLHQVMNIMGRVRSCSPAPALERVSRLLNPPDQRRRSADERQAPPAFRGGEGRIIRALCPTPASRSAHGRASP